WRFVHSPFGRILTAIKQNEVRAAFVGHHVWLYKWASFTIASAVAGLAGAMFSMAQQSAYPNVMSLHSSGFVVMMVLIGGGLVSFWGRWSAPASSFPPAACPARRPGPGPPGSGLLSSAWGRCNPEGIPAWCRAAG